MLLSADQRDQREELPPRGSGKPRPPSLTPTHTNTMCPVSLYVSLLMGKKKEKRMCLCLFPAGAGVEERRRGGHPDRVLPQEDPGLPEAPPVRGLHV